MKSHGSSRPPKWPFLLGDAAFIIVAVAIWLLEDGPLSDTALVIIFSCFFLGTALGVVPFLLDFSAARHDDLIEAREELESLAQKLSESADFIGTATGQLQAINESTLKAIHLAESLPYKMQEKVGEVAQLVQQGQDEEKESMAAELEELRENESRHLETAIDKARASLDAAVKRVEAAEKALLAATAAFESRAAAVPAAAPAPVVAPAHTPAPVETHAKESHAPRPKKELPSPAPSTVDEAPAAAAAATAHSSNGGSHETAKPREPAKHPKPEKPAHAAAPKPAAKLEKPAEPAAKPEAKSEPTPAATPSPAPAPAARRKPAKPAPEHETLPGLDPIVVRDDEDDAGEGAAAKTSDGSTRLLVTAYIGIGNKVFVRGVGPGLNPDKGQAMEFVSIGKWLWQTSEATAPITVQVYKNDEMKALGDDITIDPGHHVEVTPVFREANPF